MWDLCQGCRFAGEVCSVGVCAQQRCYLLGSGRPVPAVPARVAAPERAAKGGQHRVFLVGRGLIDLGRTFG